MNWKKSFNLSFQHRRSSFISVNAIPTKNKITWKKNKNNLDSHTSTGLLENDLHLESFSSENQRFFNQCFDKGRLKNFVLWFLLNYGEHKTVKLVEELKNVGFEYASKAGISLGVDDLKIPPKKAELIYDAEKQTLLTVNQYVRGEITGVERFQRLIDTWHRTSEILKQEVIDYFEATDILNPVYMMAFSGARGNISQVRQLVGMRGLMADPQGQIIDFPIRSNFREGLTLTEYIISSYGARKGIVDTALRTANAGYLTRRLVDVAQHVIISNFDCGTHRGIFLINMKEGTKTIHSLSQRIVGRILARDLILPNKKFNEMNKGNSLDSSFVHSVEDLLARRNDEVTLDLAFEIGKNFDKVFVRSALTCETPSLICQLCYGWSLGQGNLVSIGEAVGVVAAQSIGEPGTQLTMRTFHTGGVFSGDISDQIRAPFNGIVEYLSAIPGTLIRTPEGKIAFLTKSEGLFIVVPFLHNSFSSNSGDQTNSSLQTELVQSELSKTKANLKRYKIPPFTLLYIRNGQSVLEKEVIAQISTISRKGNVTDHAELTIKADYEGQFYSKSLGFREKFIGPKIKMTPSMLETFENKKDLSYQLTGLQGNTITAAMLAKGVQIEKVYEAWTWGYAWILSGKIYEANYQSSFFSQLGDLLNLQSSLLQTRWKLTDSQKVFYNIPKQSFNYPPNYDFKKFPSKHSFGLVSSQTPILKMDLTKILFKKQSYLFNVENHFQFLAIPFKKTKIESNKKTNFLHYTFGFSPPALPRSGSQRGKQSGKPGLEMTTKKSNTIFNISQDLVFFNKKLTTTTSNLEHDSTIMLHWFPTKTQTVSGGYFFVEKNLISDNSLSSNSSKMNQIQKPKLNKVEDFAQNSLKKFLGFLQPELLLHRSTGLQVLHVLHLHVHSEAVLEAVLAKGVPLLPRRGTASVYPEGVKPKAYTSGAPRSGSDEAVLKAKTEGVNSESLENIQNDLNPLRILKVNTSFFQLKSTKFQPIQAFSTISKDKALYTTLKYIYSNETNPLFIQTNRQGSSRPLKFTTKNPSIFVKLKTTPKKLQKNTLIEVPQDVLTVAEQKGYKLKKQQKNLSLNTERLKNNTKKFNLFQLSKFKTLDAFCKTFIFVQNSSFNEFNNDQGHKVVEIRKESRKKTVIGGVPASLEKHIDKHTKIFENLYFMSQIFASVESSIIFKFVFQKSPIFDNLRFLKDNKIELKKEQKNDFNYSKKVLFKNSIQNMSKQDFLGLFMSNYIQKQYISSLMPVELTSSGIFNKRTKKISAKMIGTLKKGWVFVVPKKMETTLIHYHKKLLYPGQKNALLLTAPIPIFSECLFINAIFNINQIPNFARVQKTNLQNTTVSPTAIPSGLDLHVHSEAVLEAVLAKGVPLLPRRGTSSVYPEGLAFTPLRQRRAEGVVLGEKPKAYTSGAPRSGSDEAVLTKDVNEKNGGVNVQNSMSWIQNKKCRFKISTTNLSDTSSNLGLICQPVSEFNSPPKMELKQKTYEMGTEKNHLTISNQFESFIVSKSPLNTTSSSTKTNCVMCETKTNKNFSKNTRKRYFKKQSKILLNKSFDSLYQWKKYKTAFHNKQMKTRQLLPKNLPNDFSVIVNPFFETFLKKYNSPTLNADLVENQSALFAEKNQSNAFIPFVSRLPLNVNSYLIKSTKINDLAISYNVFSVSSPSLSQFDYSLYPFLFQSMSGFLSFYLTKTLGKSNSLFNETYESFLTKYNFGQITSATSVKNQPFELNKFYQKLTVLIPFIFETPCFTYKTIERLNLRSLSSNSNLGHDLQKTTLPQRGRGFKGLNSKSLEDIQTYTLKHRKFRPKYQTSLSQLNYSVNNELVSSKNFCTTNYYSPFNGEIVYTHYPTMINSKESNGVKNTKVPGLPERTANYSCMFLTKNDLMSYYLPSNNFQQMRNQISTEANKKKYIIRDTLVKFLQMSSLTQQSCVSPQGTEDRDAVLTESEQYSLTLGYNIESQKIGGIKIAKITAGTPLSTNSSLLGDFFVYGDPISTTTAIQTSGQIIHYNNQKITLRRGQPIFISPKGLLRKFDGDFIDPKSPVITLSYQRLKTGDIIQGIPKVEQFFEARTTKRGRLFRDSLPSLLKALFNRYQTKLPFDLAVRQSFYKIQQIVVDGVQRVYKSQGVTIAEKHLEVIVKQMTSKVRILDGAQTGFFAGEIVDLCFVEKINTFLIKKITYEPLVLGITKASLEVDSFLSAASFQQTTRVLSKAAIFRKKDFLKGLKENVILGNLIPAGTGYLVYLDNR